VIYLGDNGTWMFGPRREFIDNLYITRQGRGKGTSFEAGAQVEFAIRGPGIKPNSMTSVPVSTVDLFPTILQLAGLESPKTVPNRDGSTMVPLDGQSMAPVLFKGAKQLRDPDRGYLLTEATNPIKNNIREAAARNARYKIVCDEKADTSSCAFYDLRSDPLEEYPLAKPESCADYDNGKWTPAKQQWHYCRLQQVIGQKSFLAARK
jgi:arylsulfatase A-like enzyme